MNIKGIIPALVTPFDSNEKVDYGVLTELVNRLIDQGVDGFYACGSTAECFLLTDDERKKAFCKETGRCFIGRRKNHSASQK